VEKGKKLKSKKTDMLKTISKQSGKSVVGPEEENEGYGGKDLQKRKVFSLERKSEVVMDDESGESMELMGESYMFCCCFLFISFTLPLLSLHCSDVMLSMLAFSTLISFILATTLPICPCLRHASSNAVLHIRCLG